MNKTFQEAAAYAEGLKKLVAQFPQYFCFIIPPYTHLKAMKDKLSGTSVMLGAQNMYWKDQEPYIGEISSKWL